MKRHMMRCWKRTAAGLLAALMLLGTGCSQSGGSAGSAAPETTPAQEVQETADRVAPLFEKLVTASIVNMAKGE